jgi:hypothetical protein
VHHVVPGAQLTRGPSTPAFAARSVRQLDPIHSLDTDLEPIPNLYPTARQYDRDRQEIESMFAESVNGATLFVHRWPFQRSEVLLSPIAMQKRRLLQERS